MIINNIVHGEPASHLPGHLSFSRHAIDTLRNAEDGDALINGETHQKISRKEFLYQAVSLAEGLKKLGIKKGDVVALCSENRFEMLISALAALFVGATVTTANTAYTESELSHVLNISKPKLIFCSAISLKAHLDNIKKYKYIEHIVSYDDVGVAGVLAYSSLQEKNVDVNNYEPVDVSGANDTALILYSSGTTGLPKGVMLTHLNFLCFTISSTRFYEPGLTRYLTLVPWYHGYGLMTTISYMLAGRTVIFLAGFNPQIYSEDIQKYKIEVLLTVPPIVLFLIKSPMVDEYDVSSVKVMWCAAAPLSRETTQQVLKRFPNCQRVMQAYGMTETTLSVTFDTLEGKYKPGSGGAPMPGFKLKVVDIDTGKVVGVGEKGEICVKGPGVMKGYAGNEAATREVFDSDGYLKTGDIGYYDEDGYFFIVDRLKEIVKYKGCQVPPAEVESAILQHAAVAECGVAGAPHEDYGELTTAFVVRKPNAKVSEKDIIDFVATKLSPMKRLYGGVIFVDEIPKNPSGKILRRVLKQRLAEKPKSKL